MEEAIWYWHPQGALVTTAGAPEGRFLAFAAQALRAVKDDDDKPFWKFDEHDMRKSLPAFNPTRPQVATGTTSADVRQAAALAHARREAERHMRRGR